MLYIYTVRGTSGKYHVECGIEAGVVKWTGGAWRCCQRSADAASPRHHPPVSFITAAYEKRYSETISVKGRTSPHLRGHRGTDTLPGFLPAAPVSGAEAFSKAALLLQRPDNCYCLSRPTYSKQGGGPVINKSSLSAGPQCPPLLPFEVGGNIKEFSLL